MKILNDSGIGLPPYLKWGRSHSGCYFCFFQKAIEWVRLLENHEEKFDKAQAYEKIDADSGKTFTWIQGMPLSELRKPDNVAAIKARYEKAQSRKQASRTDRRLIELFAGMPQNEEERPACFICQL